MARTLPPAAFAMTMATGIVSLAAADAGVEAVAVPLFVVNLIAYAILVVLTLVRVIRHPRFVLADLGDHRLGPGFFTLVAGTCLVGTQFLVLAGNREAALIFLVIGAALWLFLTYAIFSLLVVKAEKPSLEHGIGGTWLIAAVATQSVALLTTLIAREAAETLRPMLDFAALSLWLAGCMVYLWIIVLIFHRLKFLALAPADLTPPFWIAMGAMAISTLTGARLVEHAAEAPLLAMLKPFVAGTTILCWATGTWWIPLLVLLTLWRHLVKRLPFRYDTQAWGAVFPLGMYGVASGHLAAALDLPFLAPIARVMFWIALTAWALAFVGMTRSLREMRRSG